MDHDKPFKTIEVIDARTGQVCKIACMSCIRGHRTTSCGIPVCRQKIFWTVKRPGRPSNSCQCRYGNTGGCKCVTAIAKCPHKAKKGEKRSSECRCDEQGRFCCLLEPHHWDALMSLQKPVVDFYSSREALPSHQSTAPTPMSMPATPGQIPPATPQSNGSCCGTPAPRPNTPQQMFAQPSPYNGMMSPKSAAITPRFGFMGLGAPMGSADTSSQDVMSWNGDSPIAPREHTFQVYEQQQQHAPQPPPTSSCCQSSAPTIYEEPQMEVEESSCCQGSTAGQIPEFAIGDPFAHPEQLESFQPANSQPSFDQPYTQPTFDFDRWSQTFQAYQYPGAICQKCGLNGCTCRNCPPVMQNYGTTSWAQCCGRKHAERAPPPALPPQQQNLPIESQQVPPLEMHHAIPEHKRNGMPPHHPHAHQPQAPLDFTNYTLDDPQQPMEMQMQMLSPHELHHMDGFDDNFTMPDGADPLAFSDFLMSELDRPSHHVAGAGGQAGENTFGS